MSGVLALIPARGGSQGIPRKNLKSIGGRPLIAWSIETAKRAACIDRVIVSTDDPEIAEVSTAWGAEVPFLRPAELARDLVPDLPVFQHTLSWLEPEWTAAVVVHLRPTSPARRPGLVDTAVERLIACPGADSLRSVSPVNETPYKMWKSQDGWLEPLLGSFEEELFNQPRQRLPLAWRHDGVIDVVRRSTVLAGSMTGRKILAFELAPEEAADLDVPGDLERTMDALRYVGLV